MRESVPKFDDQSERTEVVADNSLHLAFDPTTNAKFEADPDRHLLDGLVVPVSTAAPLYLELGDGERSDEMIAKADRILQTLVRSCGW